MRSICADRADSVRCQDTWPDYRDCVSWLWQGCLVATRIKDLRIHLKYRVRLVYPLRPSLTAGVGSGMYNR